MKGIGNIIVLMFMGLMFTSCTPTSVEHGALAPAPAPGTYRTLIVGEIEADQLSEEELRTFRRMLLRKFTEKGAFSSVRIGDTGSGGDPSTLHLNGTITEFDEGSAAARAIVGFGAGAAEAAGAFRVSDATGKILMQFSADTAYAGGIGIGGISYLDMDDLLEQLAETVSEQTVRWLRGEPLDDDREAEELT